VDEQESDWEWKLKRSAKRGNPIDKPFAAKAAAMAQHFAR
jgi:hypothetical protein